MIDTLEQTTTIRKVKIEFKNLTNKNRLIDTMVAHAHPEACYNLTKNTNKNLYDAINEVVVPTIEKCIEIWRNGILGAYILICNVNGEYGLHVYKWFKGDMHWMLKVVDDIIKEYPTIFIIHHISRDDVNRIAKILNFKEIYRDNFMVKLERKNV